MTVAREPASADARDPTRGRAPLLVFGWGNPGRGDDALGPLFVERLQATVIDGGGRVGDAIRVDWLTDMQLRPEHVLDLAGRARVLLVDASADADAPFVVSRVAPQRDASVTSHAMSPEALLDTCHRLQLEPPPCTLLAIRGERFGLGESLSAPAARHLDAALAWGLRWLAEDQEVAAR
jgi:hydrogenase maturation protease